MHRSAIRSNASSKFLQNYAGRRVRQPRTPNTSAARVVANLIKLNSGSLSCQEDDFTLDSHMLTSDLSPVTLQALSLLPKSPTSHNSKCNSHMQRNCNKDHMQPSFQHLFSHTHNSGRRLHFTTSVTCLKCLSTGNDISQFTPTSQGSMIPIKYVLSQFPGLVL